MIRTPTRKVKRIEKQLREHYEVEKMLADKLRNVSRNERRTLYVSLYEERNRLIPHHPLLKRKESPELQRQAVNNQMKILRRLLDKNISFMEVGPGDCALAFHVANFVKKVYAVDVSKIITEASNIPKNFKLLLTDGCSIPVPNNSINIIYSHQLMEHLHPDDAYDQLKNILDALAPGGVYLCITPNRLNGPHDISKYFDTVATCFHLKEYTLTELSRLFKNVGFSKVMRYIRIKGKYIKFPIFTAVLCENLLERLPDRFRHLLANTKPLKVLISIHLVGIKKQ